MAAPAPAPCAATSSPSPPASTTAHWLAYGLSGRDASTAETRRILAEQHVIPALGARKLRDLSAEDVDRWLADALKRTFPRARRSHADGHSAVPSNDEGPGWKLVVSR